jgi:FAD/FMN-containing dehydrogenase
MTESHVAELAARLGRADAIIREPQAVERLSKDFYWYSPILKPLLDQKRADVIVQPQSVEEISTIVSYSFSENIPVTVRGSGTGNYGQAVPLEGGIVLDLASLDRILAIEPEGVAVCEPGARLGAIEAAARKVGWELRCYPSTYIKASVGGFLAGGSGGIGSITYGALRDNQTVRAIEMLTMEKEPRLLHFSGDEVHQILHSWGTNGIITRIWLALGTRRDWAQIAVAFPTFAEAYDFGERLAQNDEVRKRLVTIFE